MKRDESKHQEAMLLYARQYWLSPEPWNRPSFYVLTRAFKRVEPGWKHSFTMRGCKSGYVEENELDCVVRSRTHHPQSLPRSLLFWSRPYLLICISKQAANNFKVLTPMRPDRGMDFCLSMCAGVCVGVSAFTYLCLEFFFQSTGIHFRPCSILF